MLKGIFSQKLDWTSKSTNHDVINFWTQRSLNHNALLIASAVDVKILQNLHRRFVLCNASQICRFCEILWPSQNIWALLCLCLTADAMKMIFEVKNWHHVSCFYWFSQVFVKEYLFVLKLLAYLGTYYSLNLIFLPIKTWLVRFMF